MKFLKLDHALKQSSTEKLNLIGQYDQPSLNFVSKSSSTGTSRMVGWSNNAQCIMPPTDRRSEATKICGRTVSRVGDSNTLGCRSVCLSLNKAVPHIKSNVIEIELENESSNVIDSNVGMSSGINEDVSNVVVDDDRSKVLLEKDLEIIQQRHLSMDNKKYDSVKTTTDKYPIDQTDKTCNYIEQICVSQSVQSVENWKQDCRSLSVPSFANQNHVVKVGVQLENEIENEVEGISNIEVDNGNEIDVENVKSKKVNMIKRKNVKLSPKSKSSLMVKLRKSKWNKGQLMTPLKKRFSEDTSKNETDDDEDRSKEIPDVTNRSKVSKIVENFENNVKVGKVDSKDDDAKNAMKSKAENAFSLLMSSGGIGSPTPRKKTTRKRLENQSKTPQGTKSLLSFWRKKEKEI